MIVPAARWHFAGGPFLFLFFSWGDEMEMTIWISREWTDASGKRRQEKVIDPTKVNKKTAPDDAEFVVEWRQAGKRRRLKSKQRGRAGLNQAVINLAKVRSGEHSKAEAEQAVLAKETTYAVAADEYRRVLAAGNKGKKYRDEVLRGVDQFATLCKPSRLRSIDYAMLEKFMVLRREQPSLAGGTIELTTIKTQFAYLSGFFKWCIDRGYLDKVPQFPDIDAESEHYPNYTQEEFEAMLAATSAPNKPFGLETCPISLWWQTLLTLLWQTGCRRGEMLAVEWEWIDLPRRRLALPGYVRKNKQPHVCEFEEDAAALLANMQEHRQEGQRQVFLWPHGDRHLNGELDKILEAAGVEKRPGLSFHSIRHTAGLHYAEHYGLDVAREKLGHSDSETTRNIYAMAGMKARASKATMPTLRKVGGILAEAASGGGGS